jgi:hypothetical protein
MPKGLTKDQNNIAVEAEELFDEVRTDPDFAQKMAKRGYDEATWDNGRQLLADLLAQGRARAQTEADRFHATNRFHDLCDRSWDHILPLVQNSKSLFQGRPDLLTSLGLHQSRVNGNGKSRFKYPGKSAPFDQRALWQRNLLAVAQSDPEISAVLPENGYPMEHLATCAADVEAMFDANHAKERAVTALHHAVADRNDAYKRLFTWLRCAQRTAAKVRQRKPKPRLPLASED